MSHTIFEQLAVFCTNKTDTILLLNMSKGIFPANITYDNISDTIYRGNSKLQITEISEKQTYIVLTFVNNEFNNVIPINKSNIAYYLFDYCIRTCFTVREAKKLACRLISQYRRGQINNTNFIFRGKIIDVVGMEPRSLLSKSGKSSYGRSIIRSQHS